MNLKELAEKLNLSPSTVSRVLNDKPGISENTRKLVLDAVKETGFRQNYNAQNLANPKARFVGIIGRKRGGQQDQIYFHHAIELFEDYFKRHNLQCINLGVHDENIKDLGTMLEGSPLCENDLAGVIVRGQSFPVRSILSIKSTGIPMVLLENKLVETNIDSVVCEDRDASYNLTLEVIKRGFNEIVHVTGPEEWYNNRERITGYRQAMSEAGLTPRILSMPDTTVDTSAEAFKILKKKYNFPLGVTAVNDAMAIGLCKAARESGISIPDQMGITGFDDIPWAQHSYPSLTTAKVYIEEMGKLAAGRLIQLMAEPESRPVTIRVPVDTVIRETL